MSSPVSHVQGINGSQFASSIASESDVCPAVYPTGNIIKNISLSLDVCSDKQLQEINNIYIKQEPVENHEIDEKYIKEETIENFELGIDTETDYINQEPVVSTALSENAQNQATTVKVNIDDVKYNNQAQIKYDDYIKKACIKPEPINSIDMHVDYHVAPDPTGNTGFSDPTLTKQQAIQNVYVNKELNDVCEIHVKPELVSGIDKVGFTQSRQRRIRNATFDNKIHNQQGSVGNLDIGEDELIKQELSINTKTTCVKEEPVENVYLGEVTHIQQMAFSNEGYHYQQPKENVMHIENTYASETVERKPIIIPILNSAIKQIPDNVFVLNSNKHTTEERQIPKVTSVPNNVRETRGGWSHTKTKKRKVRKNNKSTRSDHTYVQQSFPNSVYSGTKLEQVRHLSSNTSVQKSKIICWICNLEFENSEQRNEHLLEKHSDRLDSAKSPVIRCEFCGTMWKSLHLLKKHKEYFHTQHARLLKCHICNKQGFTKCQLKVHTNFHLTDELYSCRICSKTFTSSRQLRQHQKTCQVEVNEVSKVRSEKPAPSKVKENRTAREHLFVCYICNRAFPDRGELQSHFSSHLSSSSPVISEYPMDPLCSKAYETKKVKRSGNAQEGKEANIPDSAAEGRKQSMYMQNQLKTLRCSKCDQVFPKLFLLQAHLARHFGTLLYTCGVCERQFTSRQDRDKHLVGHQRAISFICIVCEKTLTSFDLLKTHVTTHDG